MLFYAGIQRLLESNYNVDAEYMLITSVFGVVFNIVIIVLLFFGDQSHGSVSFFLNIITNDYDKK